MIWCIQVGSVGMKKKLVWLLRTVFGMNTLSVTKVPQIFEASGFRSMPNCVPSLVRIEQRVVNRLILEKKMMSFQRRKEVPRLMTLIALKSPFKVHVDLKDQQVV